MRRVIPQSILRLLLFFGLAVAIGFAVSNREWLVGSDPAAQLASSGLRGMLGFLLAFVLLQPLGVPGMIFVSVAAQTWSSGLGLGLALFGGWLASLTGFLLARTIARPWLMPRIPPRFARARELLGRGSFMAALQAHLLFYLAPPVAWVFGLSAIPLKAFARGCFLGILPGTLMIVFMGRLLSGGIGGRPITGIAMNLVLAIPLLVLINRVAAKLQGRARSELKVLEEERK
ncbi:MAG: hypothetical protein NDJ89_17045 [Oligoflexia bacterium]|nr:hypothetical protein [Oligoflexia bacterium]